MIRRLRTLGYLLGLVIATVTSAEESNPYETPIVLGIPDFQLVTGARRIESLQRALPELVGVGLLNEDSVTVRPRSDAWRMVRRVFPKVASEELPDRLYDPEMLDALKINTVFHGRFSEIEGVVRLEGDIENRRTGEMIAVRSVRVPVDDLVVGVGRFVLYIRTALPLLGKRDSDLTLGFRCFDATGAHVDGADDWLPDDIPLTMSALIRFASGTRLEPWRTDIGLCPDDLSTMWAKRPDLVLSGTYAIDGRKITAAVALHPFDDDVGEGIEIAKRSGVVDSIVSLSRLLADDVSAAVLALHTIGLGLPNGVGTIRDNSPHANFATGREIFRSTEIRQFDRVTELALASIHARRSLEDDPGAVAAVKLLAEIRLEQKRATDAFGLVKGAIEQHPDDISLLALRARANIAQERFRAARRDAEVLLGNKGTREDGGYLLASIAYLHGEYAAAIDILQGLGASGVELSTKSRKLLAASYRSTGKRAEALGVLTAAKEHQTIGGGVDEQLTEQLIADVRMAAEEGRNDEALRYLAEAEKVGLQDIRISWWRMVILGRQGKFEESLEEYRRVSAHEDSQMLLVLAGTAQRKLEMQVPRRSFLVRHW